MRDADELGVRRGQIQRRSTPEPRWYLPASASYATQFAASSVFIMRRVVALGSPARSRSSFSDHSGGPHRRGPEGTAPSRGSPSALPGGFRGASVAVEVIAAPR